MVQFPERLLDGYRAFIAGRYCADLSRDRTLAETGQKPRTMVIIGNYGITA